MHQNESTNHCSTTYVRWVVFYSCSCLLFLSLQNVLLVGTRRLPSDLSLSFFIQRVTLRWRSGPSHRTSGCLTRGTFSRSPHNRMARERARRSKYYDGRVKGNWNMKHEQSGLKQLCLDQCVHRKNHKYGYWSSISLVVGGVKSHSRKCSLLPHGCLQITDNP